MKIEMSIEDLDVLIQSLEYSQRSIRDAKESSPKVRRENLDRVDQVATKLRAARKEAIAS